MENAQAGRLREALRRSHAAIAMIVLLYLWAIGSFVGALAQAWNGLGPYVATAIAIRGVPGIGSGEGSMVHLTLWLVGADIFRVSVEVILAWTIAQQVYGIGPFRALSAWGKLLVRRSHA